MYMSMWLSVRYIYVIGSHILINLIMGSHIFNMGIYASVRARARVCVCVCV